MGAALAKKRKNPSRRNRRRASQSSPISAHKRHKKTLTPPIMALANFGLVSWLQDNFPDWLWVCAAISAQDFDGMRLCCTAIDIADEVLGGSMDDEEAASADTPIVDGSLTGFEAIDPRMREAVLAEWTKRGIYEDAFPESFAHILLAYDGAPGTWIVSPWMTRGCESVPMLKSRYLRR